METPDGLVEVTWSLIRVDNIRGANPHPYISRQSPTCTRGRHERLSAPSFASAIPCQGEQFEVHHDDA